MQKSKISIIVPVYNAESTLNKCIESIVNQSYSNLEIIIVNDGSTDKSEKIILNWMIKDIRVKYIKRSNFGVSASRNIGIVNSTGDYIGFVDSDDYIELTMFEELLKIAIKCKNAIIICDYNEIYKDGSDRNINDSINLTNRSSYEQIYIEEYDFTKIIGSIWCGLYKKNLFDNILFDESLCVGEDSLLLDTILFNNKSYIKYEKCLYNYCIYDVSSFHGFYDKKKFTQIIALEKICNVYRDYFEVYISCKQRVLGECRNIMMRYYRNNNVDSDVIKNVIYKYKHVKKELYRLYIKLMKKDFFNSILNMTKICLLDIDLYLKKCITRVAK